MILSLVTTYKFISRGKDIFRCVRKNGEHISLTMEHKVQGSFKGVGAHPHNGGGVGR